MNAKDIGWAKAVDAGDMTRTELVEEILDDALFDVMLQNPHGNPVDTLMLARRIINALDY